MAREEFDIYEYVHKNRFKVKVDKPVASKYYSPISPVKLKEVKIVDGKFSLKESLEDTFEKPLSTELKKHFLEIISTYKSFHEQMQRQSDIVETAETLGGIVEAAKTLTLKEAGDWFDKVTIKRNMTELEKLDKAFDKVAVEARGLDQRLHALYEDMGNILGRYYEISDLDPAVMRERLGLKKEVSESVYTIKVNRGGNTLGKKSVTKSQLKEVLSKFKSKYSDSTITVINENGKVLRQINPMSEIHSNGIMTEEMLNESWYAEKIFTGLLVLWISGVIAINVQADKFFSNMNNKLKAGKEVVISPKEFEYITNIKTDNVYTIKLDSTLSKPVDIDTTTHSIKIKSTDINNPTISSYLQHQLGIRRDSIGGHGTSYRQMKRLGIFK